MNHSLREPYSPTTNSMESFSTRSSVNGSHNRLTNKSVRAIFECLYNNTPPPIDIPFTIVPVGPNGKDLSPPSFQFDYGLYVLLRPPKRNKKTNAQQSTPKAPDHLQHLVMKRFPPETCKWQLSGPQFPVPTAIQQRYCYPRGCKEYSQCTGSALWTMYNHDGIENKEYRLLHVYYSSKRLVNDGVRNGISPDNNSHGVDMDDDLGDVHTPGRQNSKSILARKASKRHKNYLSYHHRKQRLSHSPSTASISNVSSPRRGGDQLLPSPIKIDQIMLHAPTYHDDTYNHCNYRYSASPPMSWPSIVTTTERSPTLSTNYRPQAPYQRMYERSKHLIQHQQQRESYSSEESYKSDTVDVPQVLPFRQKDLSNFPRVSNIDLIDSPIVQNHSELTMIISPNIGNEDGFDDIASIHGPVGSFQWDNDFQTTNLISDPISGDISFSTCTDASDLGVEDALTLTDSTTPSGRRRDYDYYFGNQNESNNKGYNDLSMSLHSIHKNICDNIYASPIEEQAELVHLFSVWARRLADDPLVCSKNDVTVNSNSVSTNNDNDLTG